MTKSQRHGSSQRERLRSPIQSDPVSLRIVTDLLTCQTRSACHRCRQSDWNLLRAGVTVGGHSDCSDLAIRDGIAHLRRACVTCLASAEAGGQVVLLDGDEWPVDEATEFLHDNFDPRLEDGDVAGYAVDRDGREAIGAQVGLVEHIPVVVETQKATCSVETLGVEEVSECTRAGGCIDPLLCCAVSGVAIEVDTGSPARDYGITVEAIGGSSRSVRVHKVLLIAEDTPSVVADTVVETSSLPGSENVTVMQACNRWGNQTAGRESGGVAANARYAEPLLIELYLLQGI